MSGWVSAQDPLAVGEGALQQRDAPRDPPGFLVGVARLPREVRVLGWSGPRIRSQSARFRSNRGRASAIRPASWYAPGEVVAEGQGVGVVRA